MLDVTKEDIENLNDTDLKILIGKLCEAELYDKKNDTCDVSYGGDQDEKDGGIDVKICASKIIDDEGFIPRNNTVFQVKKPSMPPSRIKTEMTNKDASIKKCITELSEKCGAYVIVSSGDDLTELTYEPRIDLMKQILKDFGLEDKVVVQFYDSNKIATWVNKYPSLVCWVNDNNNRNTNGWTSYCNWSSRNTSEQPFIMNEDSVIFRNDFNKDNEIKLIDGINEIRKTINIEKNSVRLAGLSGVGKTRLAQALFDNSIGENSLNKESVIYGDVGDSLSPEPITFIQRLEELNKKVILIVDNCEASMHNKLTELCQRESSKISLLTIEYDVKEDDNVDSNNYYLGTTSNEVLEQLIKREYKEISDINIDTIVKCSDGNFRIAIYLAKSISNQKNIGVLKSEELFNRLFYQGSNIDQELLMIGEVCSLFYSFDITYSLEDENNELNIIAGLISKDPLIVFKKVEELKLRQIVQRRGNMRAVLPPALANKLAMDFLKKYPTEHIIKIISKNSRLCLSFFRRLKFLHLSKEAQLIAKSYFEVLEDKELINANNNLMEKIRCITILNPELILQRVEKISEPTFFSRDNQEYYEWTRILSYIAYEENLFKRAVELMIRFTLTERVNENYNSIRNILYGFFHIYLSYTHAPLNIRLEVVTDLLLSTDDNRNNLGIKLVDELLEYGYFTGSPIYDCGSQIRDYGLEPNPNDWFKEALEYCKRLLKDNVCYEEVKEILAKNFMNLSSIGFFGDLETIVEENLQKCSWPRIWVSLLAIKHFDSDKVPVKIMSRIDSLIKKVKPSTIPDKIQVFLCKGKNIYLELDDTTDDYQSIDDVILNLGKEIASDPEHLEENLILLDDTCNMYRIVFFTQGLCEVYKSKSDLVYILLDLINDSNKSIIKQIASTVIGLYHVENIDECSEILDALIENEKYNKYYCCLQLSYKLAESDIARINKALSLDIIDKLDLSRIEWYLDNISTDSIINLFEQLPNPPQVQRIILESLFKLREQRQADNKLKAYTRKIIVSIDYDELNNSNNHHDEYIISELIKYSFSIEDGKEDAILIFEKINNLLNEKYISFYKNKKVLTSLIELYPNEFLDIFINYNGKPEWNIKIFFRKSFNLNDNILASIQDGLIIEWIENTGKIEEISYLIEPYIYNKETECYSWSKLGNYIMEKHYNNSIVINNIIKNVFPNSWSNEYSTVLKKRENLFLEMKNNSNVVISDLGKKKHAEILQSIDRHLLEEKSENEERFNTFE